MQGPPPEPREKLITSAKSGKGGRGVRLGVKVLEGTVAVGGTAAPGLEALSYKVGKGVNVTSPVRVGNAVKAAVSVSIGGDEGGWAGPIQATIADNITNVKKIDLDFITHSPFQKKRSSLFGDCPHFSGARYI